MSAEEPRAAAARLAHDVGKYVARTARNLRDHTPSSPPLPPLLAGMLARDLYALPAGRALAVFDALAAALPPDAALTRARALLAALDPIEADVRRGAPAAVARAVEIACAVEALLRDHARAAAGAPGATP